MKTTYTFTKLFLLVAILFAAVSCSENEKEVCEARIYLYFKPQSVGID